MKNVLIVEDKQLTAEGLKTIVKKIDSDINVLCADTKEKAYTYAMENAMNLMLVDIVLNPRQPGDVSGIHFVQNIRKVEQYRFVPIIMVTSIEDPKLYSYSELHCYSYIEKPYDVGRTTEIIRQALEYKREEKKKKKYVYKKESVFYTLNLEDVIYIENKNKKVIVYMTNGQTEIPYISVVRLLVEIDNHDFIQCNRNCIVNKKYIESVDGVNRYIRLKGVLRQIDIGLALKKKVLAELKND